jgi:hypothetical protein
VDPADAGSLEPEPSEGRARQVAIWTFAVVGMAASLAGGYAAFRALRPPPPTPASTPTPQPTPTPNPTPTPLVRRPGARHWLEALAGDRKGQHSIRINDQYRICFVWQDGEAQRVEVVDYH